MSYAYKQNVTNRAKVAERFRARNFNGILQILTGDMEFEIVLYS
jgi:hypothetical protein